MLFDTESCLIPRNIRIKYSGTTGARLQNRSEVYQYTRYKCRQSERGDVDVDGGGGTKIISTRIVQKFSDIRFFSFPYCDPLPKRAPSFSARAKDDIIKPKMRTWQRNICSTLAEICQQLVKHEPSIWTLYLARSNRSPRATLYPRHDKSHRKNQQDATV